MCVREAACAGAFFKCDPSLSSDAPHLHLPPFLHLFFPSEVLILSPGGISLELNLSALNSAITAGLGQQVYNITNDALILDKDG